MATPPFCAPGGNVNVCAAVEVAITIVAAAAITANATIVRGTPGIGITDKISDGGPAAAGKLWRALSFHPSSFILSQYETSKKCRCGEKKNDGEEMNMRIRLLPLLPVAIHDHWAV